MHWHSLRFDCPRDMFGAPLAGLAVFGRAAKCLDLICVDAETMKVEGDIRAEMAPDLRGRG